MSFAIKLIAVHAVCASWGLQLRAAKGLGKGPATAPPAKGKGKGGAQNVPAVVQHAKPKAKSPNAEPVATVDVGVNYKAWLNGRKEPVYHVYSQKEHAAGFHLLPVFDGESNVEFDNQRHNLESSIVKVPSVASCEEQHMEGLNILVFRSYKGATKFADTAEDYEKYLLNANSGGIQWLVNSDRVTGTYGGAGAVLAVHLVKVQCAALFNDYKTCNKGFCHMENINEVPTRADQYMPRFGARARPGCQVAWFASPDYVEAVSAEPERPVNGIHATDNEHFVKHGWQHLARVAVFKEDELVPAKRLRNPDASGTAAPEEEKPFRNLYKRYDGSLSAAHDDLMSPAGVYEISAALEHTFRTVKSLTDYRESVAFQADDIKPDSDGEASTTASESAAADSMQVPA